MQASGGLATDLSALLFSERDLARGARLAILSRPMSGFRLFDLNPEQERAVRTTEGPLLILAGAGTGKTRVITARVAFLIAQGVDPAHILAVTFTNKAATEMRERLAKLIPPEQAKLVTMSTFHALCVRVLRQDIDKLGYKRNFSIYDEGDTTGLIKKIITRTAAKDEKLEANVAKSLISKAKGNGWSEVRPGEEQTLVAAVFARYQQERILLAAPEEVVRETDRLLRFVETRDCHLLIELLVQISLVELALSPIAGRLPDLQKQMPTLADRLDRLSQRLETQLTNALIGEFVLANHTCENPAATRQAMGSFAPASLWDDLMWGPQVRAGRGPLLHREMAWILMARKNPTPADLVLTARGIDRESQDLRTWMPTETLSLQLMGSVSMDLNMTARCQLRLQLMAAELRGAPWPIDAFDPSGKPLRRFERDGALMGAYTVSDDGVDHGGDKKKDRYFPLYGPLELPAPAKTPTTP